MKKIKTLRDLQDYLNKEIRLDATCVTQAQVDQFGKDTGDVNDHNSISTKHFNKPAVQGFFSLGLFGGFHKQVCQIENADPLNAEVINAVFSQPIYVGQTFIPMLKIEFVQDQGNRIKVIWRYELHSEDFQALLKAQLRLIYVFPE